MKSALHFVALLATIAATGAAPTAPTAFFRQSLWADAACSVPLQLDNNHRVPGCPVAFQART